MMMDSFDEIEHTADWALRIRGTNLSQLMKNAAIGMMRLMGAQAGSGSTKHLQIEIFGSDREELLINWLEELVFRMEAEEVTFESIEVQTIDDTRLIAQLCQVPRVAIFRGIKAVTYHNLNITRADEGLQATVVFDV